MSVREPFKASSLDWDPDFEKLKEALPLVQDLRGTNQDLQNDAADELSENFLPLVRKANLPDDAEAENLRNIFKVAQVLLDLGEYDLQDLERENDQKTQEIDELRKECASLHEELQETVGGSDIGVSGGMGRTEASDLRKQIAELEQKLAQYKLQTESGQEQIDKLQKDADILIADKQAAEQKLQSQVQRTQEVEKELDSARRAAAEREDQDRRLALKLRQQSRDAQKGVKEVSDLSKKYSDLQQAKEELESELATYSEEILRVNGELKKAQVALDHANSQYTRLEKLSAADKERASKLEQQLDSREEDEAQKIQKMTRELAEFKQIIENERHSHSDTAAELRRTKRQLEQVRNEQTEQQLYHRNLELMQQVESLRNQLADSRHEAKENRDRASMAKQETESALDQVEVVKREFEVKMQLQQAKHEKAFKDKEHGFARERRELNEANSRIADLEEENAALSKRMMEYESGSFQLSDAVREIKDIKSKLKSTEDKLKLKAKMINTLTETQQDLIDKLSAIMDKYRIPKEMEFDLEPYRAGRALELARLKAVVLQQERDLQQMEAERLEHKRQLRTMALRRGEDAYRLGLKPEHIAKIEAMAEYYKSEGADGAAPVQMMPGDDSKVQKLAQKIETLESENRELITEAQANQHKLEELQSRVEDSQREQDVLRQVNSQLQDMFKNHVTALPAPAQESSAADSSDPPTPGANTRATTTPRTTMTHVTHSAPVQVQAASISTAAIEQLFERLQNTVAIGDGEAAGAARRAREAELQLSKLREENNRLRSDIEDARRDRDYARQELARARTVQMVTGSVPPMPADEGISAGEGMPARTPRTSQTQGGKGNWDNSEEVQALTAELVETLDSLQNKEEELRSVKSELDMYRREFGFIWQQQCMLYQEHASSRNEHRVQSQKLHKLQEQVRLLGDENKQLKIADSLNKEKDSAVTAASQFDTSSDDPVTLKRHLVAAQAEVDVLHRRLTISASAEALLRAENGRLQDEFESVEGTFRLRQGEVQRRVDWFQAKVEELSDKLDESVPESRFKKLVIELNRLQDKRALYDEREMEVLKEETQLEELKKNCVSLQREVEDTRALLVKEKNAAASAMERLKSMALKDGPELQKERASLNYKLMQLEVESKHAKASLQLVESRLEQSEAAAKRDTQRIRKLEEDLSAAISERFKVQQDLDNANEKMIDSLPPEEAQKLKSQYEDCRRRVLSLEDDCVRLREVAEVAKNQAIAIRRVQEDQRREVEEARSLVGAMQGKGDLHQTAVMTSHKALALEKERDRLRGMLQSKQSALINSEEIRRRLEDNIDNLRRKILDDHESSLQRRQELETRVSDLEAAQHASVSLDKAEKWRDSIRQLTEQQKEAQASRTQALHAAEELSAQVRELEEDIKGKEGTIDALRQGHPHAQEVITVHERMSELRLRNLKAEREVRQLKEREAHLLDSNDSLERSIMELESKLVEAEDDRDKKCAELASEIQQLQRRIQTGDSRPTADRFMEEAAMARSESMATRAASTNGVSEPLNDSDRILLDSLKTQVEVLEAQLALARKGGVRMASQDKPDDAAGQGDEDTGRDDALSQLSQMADSVVQGKEEVIRSLREGIRQMRNLLDTSREEANLAKDEYQQQIDALEHRNNTLADEKAELLRQLAATTPSSSSRAHHTPSVFDEHRTNVPAAKSTQRSSSARTPSKSPVHVSISSDLDDDGLASAEQKTRDVSARARGQGDKDRQLEYLKKELLSAFKLEKQLREQIKQYVLKQTKLRKTNESLRKKVNESDAKVAEQVEAKVKVIRRGLEKIDDDKARRDKEHPEPGAEEMARQFQHQVEELSGQLGRIKSRAERLEGDKVELSGMLAKAEQENQNLHGELLACKQKVAVAQSVPPASATATARSTSTAPSDDSKVSAMESQISELTAEVKSLQSIRDRQSDAIKSKEQELSEMQRKLASSENEAKKSAKPGLTPEQWEKMKSLESKLESAEKGRKRYKEELQQATDSLKERLKEKEELEKKVKQMQARRAREERAKNGSGGNVFDRLDQYRKDKEFAESELESCRQGLMSLKAEMEKQSTLANNAEEKARIATERMKAAEASCHSLKQGNDDSMQQEVGRLEDLVTSYEQTVAEKEAEISELREKLMLLSLAEEHNKVLREAAQRKADDLKQDIEAVQGGKQPGQREHGTKELEDLIKALRGQIETMHKENVELNKKVASNVKYMNAVKEIKLLRSQIKEMEDPRGSGPGAELAKLKTTLSGVKDRLKSTEEALAKSRSQLKREQEEVSSLSQKLESSKKRSEENCKKLETEIAGVKKASASTEASLKDQLSKAEGRAAHLEATLQQLGKLKVDQGSKLDDQSAVIVELRGRLHEATKRVSQLESAHSSNVAPALPIAEAPASDSDSEEVVALRRDLRRARRAAREADSLRNKVAELEGECKELRGELDSFDPSFFEEIEDLKYQHRALKRLSDHYEHMLEHLADRYGFPFNPSSARQAAQVH